MATVWTSVTRTKQLETEQEGSLLCRCLSTFDLVILGLGIYIGCGIFLMQGFVIKDYTGPSISVSFLIAGVAAFLTALCYAEFASHVQRAGSIYVYMYATIGELPAFLIGWNTLLLYTADTAAEIKMFSVYIDSLCNGIIRNKTIEALGTIHVAGFAEYPDFLALGILILTLLLVAFGVSISVNIGNIITTFSVALLIIISVMGYVVADGTKTWTDQRYGGFFPYGFEGTLEGASLVLYTYIGCDCLPLMAEEAKQPTKSVPRALLISTLLTIILYICASSSLGLMVPYFDIDITSPYAAAFAQKGLLWAKYVVAAATITAAITAVLGLVISLIRLPYSISCDGLLFHSLSYIHPPTHAPIVSMVIFGGLAGALSVVVDLKYLMFGVSASALVNFIAISTCVIYLRYMPEEDESESMSVHVSKTVKTCRIDSDTDTEETEFEDDVFEPDEKQLVKTEKRVKESTEAVPERNKAKVGQLKTRFQSVPVLDKLKPGETVRWALLGFLFCGWVLILVLEFATNYIRSGVWWAILLVVVFSIGVIFTVIIMMIHQGNEPSGFKVPLVPILPCLSILIMLGLMVNISINSWICTLIWMLIGCIIYFTYGIRHSKENSPASQSDSVMVVYKSQSSQDERIPKLNETITKPQLQKD